MAPVLPQINITPPRGAKQRDTSDVFNAFNMQLKAESNRQSPLQSFTQGVGAVQEIVSNQQRIAANQQAQELNELEKERRELALNLQKEQQAEDVAFTQSIKTGDLNAQTNALLNTSPDVLIRNKDAALAVADRIRAKGSPEQAQIIEEEVMPIIDRQRIERQKAAEEKARQDREDFKFEEGQRRETAKIKAKLDRKTPEELEHEAELAQIKRDTALANQRAAEARAGKAGQTVTKPVSRTQEKAAIKNDVAGFSTQLELANTKLDPRSGMTEGQLRADDYKKVSQMGQFLFDRNNGQPTEINGVMYNSQRDYQDAVDKAYTKHLPPAARKAIEDAAKQRALAAVNPTSALSPSPSPTATPGIPDQLAQALQAEIVKVQQEIIAVAKAKGKENQYTPAQIKVLAEQIAKQRLGIK